MSDGLSHLQGSLLCHGRYRVVGEINRGGSAVVYRGIDRLQQRDVALKVMHAEDDRLDVHLKAFQREVDYAAGVVHKNIVQLLDVFAEGQRHVIVWELVKGPDLLDLLNIAPNKKLPESTVAHYFQQLLNAVIFMHNNGFCHRDLKAENCVVDTASQCVKALVLRSHMNLSNTSARMLKDPAKSRQPHPLPYIVSLGHAFQVIDFGLSKRLESAMTLGIGTPDYMAPELLLKGHLDPKQPLPTRHTLARQPRYNPRAVDVWALGVMLYLLVTGTYPFEDASNPGNVTATLRNIMHGRMQPIPEHVSPACADVITKALTRSGARRIKLDELADHPWIRSRAQDFQQNQASSGSVNMLKEVVPIVGCSHASVKEGQPDWLTSFRAHVFKEGR